MLNTIKNLRTQLIAEYPHHCRACDGRGGQVTHANGGEWCPNWIEIDPCEECTSQGIDPLNTNLTLLEGGVSPTSGVDMVDVERDEDLIPDLLAIEVEEYNYIRYYYENLYDD